LIPKDKEVDALNKQIHRELAHQMIEDPETITRSLHLLVANLTGVSLSVVISPFAAGQVSVRSLDTGTAQNAMFEPESFRQNWRQVEIQSRELILDMAPYATVRIDV
jgi:hypothetical protein